MRRYGNINQCFEESKRVLDFIEANPIIQKMADAAEEADLKSTNGYYALAMEHFAPWSLCLKWSDRPVHLLHGYGQQWNIEAWEEDSTGPVIKIGPLTVGGVLNAMGISAHDIAEEAAEVAAKN